MKLAVVLTYRAAVLPRSVKFSNGTVAEHGGPGSGVEALVVDPVALPCGSASSKTHVPSLYSCHGPEAPAVETAS